jgi:acyl CoA:acetate/3-ketoacid CoA transferase alpha subunit
MFKIPAFFTATGYGTVIQEGGNPIQYAEDGKTVIVESEPRESRNFDGKNYVMEKAIKGDIGLVKAWQADEVHCLFVCLRFFFFNMDYPEKIEDNQSLQPVVVFV